MSAVGPIEDSRASAARPWRPAPAHWLLGAAHLGAVAAFVAQPGTWPWALGAIGASHAVAGAFAFNATSGFLGPVIARLPPVAAARGEIALTFDDGPDPVITPRVLDILDAHRARATFFCIARQALAHRALAREIVARGHDVENHSVAHAPTLGFVGPRRLAREIGDAQKMLADVTGVAPRLFRPPFGVRTPLTEPALARLGMYCVGWTVRSYDTVDRDGARVARRVIRRMKAGSIVLLHDGASLIRRSDAATASVLVALPRVLAAISGRGGRAVALHSALS